MPASPFKLVALIPSVTRFRLLAVAIACPAIGFLTAAQAGDSALAAKGNVASASTSSISVTLRNKALTETFIVTETTKILRDRQPISTPDIQTGEAVVVIGHKDNGQQYADTINLRAQR